MIIEENQNLLKSEEISITDQSKVEQKIYHDDIEISNLPSNFFVRNFCRPAKEGSLRVAILSLTKMAWGIGIFTLPFYVSKVGVSSGFLILFIAALINYYIQILIFKNSLFFKKNNFKDLIRTTVPFWIYRITNVTFLFDYFAGPLIYSISSWKMCENFLLQFGVLKDKELIDPKVLDFNETNPQVTFYRIVFFAILIIINFPFIVKKRLDSLRYLSLISIISILFIVFIILYQLPYYYQELQNQDQLIVEHGSKKFSLSYILSFYGIMSSYGGQVFSLDIKNELHNPTMRRLTKVSTYTIFYHFFTFTIIGVCSYQGLGDLFTPQLIFLKKNFQQFYYSHCLLQVGQFAFMVCSMFSLSLYNISLKKYLIKLFSNNQKKIKKRKYILYSYLPFFIMIFIGVSYPNIIKVFNLFGLSCWSFDTYIIPVLIENKRLQIQKKSKLRITANYLLVCFIFCTMVLGMLKNLNILQISFIYFHKLLTVYQKIGYIFIMDLNVALNEFYFYSIHYLCFLILQIVISAALITYVFLDFRVNIYDRKVFIIEVTLAFLMLLDIFLYSYISKCRISVSVVLEWLLILFYSAILLTIYLGGLKEASEELELMILLSRVTFVVLRSIVIIYKLLKRKHRDQKNQIQDLKLEDSNIQNSNVKIELQPEDELQIIQNLLTLQLF